MDRSRKRELRAINLSVWDGKKDAFVVQKSQDSSLKKNTAFIKRLRTSITGPNVNIFTQEVAGLSLHKYLSEIISACYEGLCKLKTPADIAAGVEVISALHQRFGPTDFTGYLGWFVGRGLVSPDKSHLKSLTPEVREREEKDRLIRQRTLLRIATELWLTGVLRSLNDAVRPESESRVKESIKFNDSASKSKSVISAKPSSAEDDPFPLEVLKDLLGHDREHVNLPIVVLFIKTFAWDVLGIQPQITDGRKTPIEGAADDVVKDDDSADNEESAGSPITPDDLQQRFKNVLTRYFDDVKTHLIRDEKTLTAQGRRNAEAYVRSGEVFEDRQSNFEKQTKAQERLIANAQTLADILGVEMPDFKNKDEATVNGDSMIGLVKTGDYLKAQGDGPGIWEDEDERRFYENIIDLKDRVPGILLEDGKKKKVDTDDQIGKRTDPNASTENGTVEPKPNETDDQSIAIANRSVGAQVDGLLARLPELQTKDSLDGFAVEFCFLNSKASRNRLIKSLQEVPKGRTDLLPYYGRIIATLSKYMPDIPQAVISHLDDEFRSLQRRKSKEFLGAVRLLNIRYMAELTKFGIVPEHVIFHCFKVCLDDLSRTNIEILGNLMENCGRYLLRTPESSPRMTSFLETLQRKKSAQHLEQRERLILENAIYHVNPPERPTIEQKERTPMELFIQKVLCEDMNKKTVEKSIKQLRKLHWEEEETQKLILKYLIRPWKIQYNNVPLLAVVVSVLNRYYPSLGQLVIDELIEAIVVGLQVNEVKYNQRRIAQVKYLGELYVYKMIDTSCILDTMYKILGFGYESGMPKENVYNPTDPPHDLFRIRLICILLETCAQYFPKKKLNFFINVFQYYIKVKEVLSMEIEFAIQDAFAVISSDLKLVATLQEAGNALSEAVKLNYQLNKASEPDEIEEEHVSDDGIIDDDVDDADDGPDEDGKSSQEDSEDDDDEDDLEVVEEDDDEEFKRQKDDRDPEVDADFDRELAKLMSDSMDSRKFERKNLFDVPLPMRRTQREAAPFEETPDTPVAAPSVVKFSLLTKRGNRQQTKDIDLPADSLFAVAMRHQQEAEKEEKKRLKDLVLNLDLRDDTDVDGTASFSHLLRPNPNLKAGRPRSQGRADSLRDSFLDSIPAKVNVPLQCSAFESQSVNVFSVEQKTHYPIQGGSIDRNLPNPYFQPRTDRPAKKSAPQRGRQLQVSDLDWYGSSNPKANDVPNEVVSNDEATVYKENKGRRGGHGQSHARGRRR